MDTHAHLALEKYLENFKNPTLMKSPLTHRVYSRDLGKFYDYFKFETLSDLENVSKEQFRDFIFSLDTLSNESKNGVIRAINAFINYLKSEDAISIEHITSNRFGGKKFLPKTEREHKPPLSEEEVVKIYKACDDVQEKFMIAFMIYTGLRASSIASVKMSDIEDGLFRVRAKGNKLVPVKMSSSLIELFEEYKKSRDNKKEYLFYPTQGRGAKNNKISSQTPYTRLKSILSRTDIALERQKQIVAHTFRHAFVTKIIASTGSMETARQAVHHADIKTTNMYNDDKFGLGLQAMEKIKFNLE